MCVPRHSLSTGVWNSEESNGRLSNNESIKMSRFSTTFRKRHPRGEVSYLAGSLTKNPEEEEPPRRICTRCFDGGPLSPLVEYKIACSRHLLFLKSVQHCSLAVPTDALRRVPVSSCHVVSLAFQTRPLHC